MFQKRPADQFARAIRICGGGAMALCVVSGLLLALVTLRDVAATTRAMSAWQAGAATDATAAEVAAMDPVPGDAGVGNRLFGVVLLRRIAISSISLLVLSPVLAYLVLPYAYWHFGERGFAALSVVQIVVLLLSAAPFLLAVVQR